jgi:subtilisin family serine protease
LPHGKGVSSDSAVRGSDAVTWDFVHSIAHAGDDNGHGTHVTGMIAQSSNNGIGSAGVALGAKIMPIKVLAAIGTGPASALADGIRFAADHGAQVINISVDTSQNSEALRDAVQYAHCKGVVIVAGAGNDGTDSPVYGDGLVNAGGLQGWNRSDVSRAALLNSTRLAYRGQHSLQVLLKAISDFTPGLIRVAPDGGAAIPVGRTVPPTSRPPGRAGSLRGRCSTTTGASRSSGPSRPWRPAAGPRHSDGPIFSQRSLPLDLPPLPGARLLLHRHLLRQRHRLVARPGRCWV